MSTSPRTIRRDTRVFISAVTRELGSVRKLVKKGLEDNDYHAIEQDSFPPDYRDLRDKLRERIASCDAVIHIAGLCYGAESPERPADAPRRSYTQLEYDIAIELGKPVYVFLTGDGFPADPHDLEPPELQELQRAHRQRLTSTGKEYNPTASLEQLDQKVRSMRLKVERLEEELDHVDRRVAVTGRKLQRWILAVATLGVAGLMTLVYLGWRQHVESRAQEQERAKQESERLAAEEARNQAQTIEQIQRQIAERFLLQLVTSREITPQEARQRALKELPVLVSLQPAEIESLIESRIAPRAADASLSPLDRARAALAMGDFDAVLKAAEDEKKQDRDLAMLEGTAALARFHQSPTPQWNERALAAFQRAMALADPTSAAEWETWTKAAVPAAEVLHSLARYPDAERLLRESRRLHEVNNRSDSPEVAVVLNNLAVLLVETNRMGEAEPLSRRALAIAERSRGSNDPDVAIDLNNLAELLRVTNRTVQAELLLRRALAITETSLGADHPAVAIRLNNLALLLQATNRMAQAEPLFRRALQIAEQCYGTDHPRLAIRLNNLALLLRDTNRPAAAEPLYRRSLAIDERSNGTDHPRVATRLNNLSRLLQDTNRMAAAEPLCRRALALDERAHGPDHPAVAHGLNQLALLLKSTHRTPEAEPLYRRALLIHEQSYGPDHPTVATRLNNLAQLLQATDRNAAAELLFRRALAINERSYGPDHLRVGNALGNLASLLQHTNRVADAEAMYRRALVVEERSYGPDHIDVAMRLNNLATLLIDTKRTSEAAVLMARAVCVHSRFGRATGHQHPRLQLVLTNYRRLLAVLRIPEHEIAARIKAATEGTEKLSPIVPEIERLLGPAKPTADVLGSLDRQYEARRQQAACALRPNEPIAPYLDSLLQPNADCLNVQGEIASREGDYASAVVLFEAALGLAADQATPSMAKIRTRMNLAAARRELGMVKEARDELSSVLPELEQISGADASLIVRAHYQLAVCQWRLGEQAAAQHLAEESLAACATASKSKPLDPRMRQQSEELLEALKNRKAPPPLPAINAQSAIEAARARYRAREALAKLPLDQKATPLLDQMLGPARPTKEVFDELDRQYRAQGKPAIWYLPLTEPISRHLDQLLGPTRSVKEVLDALDRQYREQGKPTVWFLPLDQPISPHLDELLGSSTKRLPGRRASIPRALHRPGSDLSAPFGAPGSVGAAPPLATSVALFTSVPSVRIDRSPTITRSDPSKGTQGSTPVGDSVALTRRFVTSMNCPSLAPVWISVRTARPLS
jgi:hypothetical protein